MTIGALLLVLPISLQLAARGPQPESQPSAGSQGVSALLARVDAEWPRRDDDGRIDRIRSLLEQAEAMAPADYEVLWRMARLETWLADDPALSSDEKSRLGKRAWEYGDRATAANPGRVEGWYFAAVGVGYHALGIGVLKALGDGIEGKFKERLSNAQRIDPRFYSGAIDVAWGRFYYELPWPLYDPHRSEQELLKALRMNPEDVRARVFLAELYQREKHPKEARQLLEQAAAHRPGAYDPPEERRSMAIARKLLASMAK